MSANESSARKKRLSQSDVPSLPLEKALRVAQALHDSYAGQPSSALDVAMALKMAPTSGGFRAYTGASMAYGLTEGAAQAGTISLTSLGRRIVAPTIEGDDLAARRDAFLRPRVINEFLTNYDGSPVPTKDIAMNVLATMGVPRDATGKTLDLILEGASSLGMLRELKGKQYVQLEGPAAGGPSLSLVPTPSADDDGNGGLAIPPPPDTPVLATTPSLPSRVFVSHGKNKKIVAQIKEILDYGELEAVVSVDKESTAKPVPDKVMEDMRSCAYGIVQVGAEMRITDVNDEEHILLNQNVLIEIGAAMALYKQNFILLVETGVTLPSNLQGLYEVRYSGDSLDHEATMRLMKALRGFKANP